MGSIDLIQSPILAELKSFKNLYDKSLLSDNSLFNDIVIYLKHQEGKMMRPILVLLIAKLYGKIRTETFNVAVSLELLHTASLLHDDVVDESFIRRRQPSVNAVYDNKVAVLAGDYLLAICVIEAQKTNNNGIINIISNLARDLAGGELLQLSSNLNNQFFSEEIYIDVITKKTATLFSACAESAALSMEADADSIECTRLFGKYVGLCFQIKDDIFDYFGDGEIGKPTGNDMLEGRLTLPVIHALNATDEAGAKKIALKIRRREANLEEINELTDFAKQHKGIEYAHKIMNGYKEKALALLSVFPDTDVKHALVAYVDYMIERKK